MEHHYVTCQCSDFSHSLRFTLDPSDGELWLETHLYNWSPWYKRLWAAILYVFKRTPCYGHYDCTLLKPEDFPRLHTLLDRAEQAAARAHTLLLDSARKDG